MTSSIQRFAMFPEISVQEPQSVYDVIQQLEKNVYSSSENVTPLLDEIQLKEEIALLKKGIKDHHIHQKSKYLRQKIQKEAQRAILQQQLQELKIPQAPVSSSQDSSSVDKESIRKLEQELQQLLVQRNAFSNHGVRHLQPSLQEARGEILTSSTRCGFEESRSRISQSQTQILRLERAHQRQSKRNEVLDAQINTLEETYAKLLQKQTYYREETNKYRQAVIKKIHQRDHTLTVYRQAQDRVNSLVERKKDFLTQRLQEFKQFAETHLKEMKENCKQELRDQKERVNAHLAADHNLNQASIATVEQLKKQQVEQAKAIQDTHLQQIAENLNNYWNYVNRTKFALYNTHYDEYLYAAEYSRPSLRDSERRWVYTWKPKGWVTQGGWQLIQYTNGTFGIKNTTHEEYLYAANYKPRSYHKNENKRLAFTWKPGNQVVEGYWQLIPVHGEKNTYRIFNTDHQGYLYPESESSPTPAADAERRPVHVGRNSHKPENEGKWKIRPLG